MNKKSLTAMAVTLPLVIKVGLAYELNDSLLLSGVLAGAIQCQNLTDAPGFSNTCESAVPFQPKVSFRPTETDEVFFRLGFAAGNGLNDKTPFNIPPWAASLEEDVKNINGRNRDYLLTAWYKHTFTFADEHQLGATFGIIDGTKYLDENAYANDEYTQFMNSALTNGPNVFIPSYDLGVALQWDLRSWSFRAILMDVGENDDGNNFSFYGLQAGYHVNNKLGSGNYRIVLVDTSQDFLDPTGTKLHDRSAILLSFDQELGKILGGWIRFDLQADDAATDYSAIYSGGIDIKGKAWERYDDNIGLGYAYLDGGNLEIEKSHVAEAYYRWQLTEVLGLTADVQYMQDDYKTGGGPHGWIFGLRATAEF